MHGSWCAGRRAAGESGRVVVGLVVRRARGAAPLWQVEVCDAHGVDAGRVDAWWKAGVAGEVDGRTKYRLKALERGGVDAGTLARTLDEERLREMALRRTGAHLVRWDPRDVLRPDREAALAAHLLRELARPSRFTGRLFLP